jgi:hypothetical protein
MTTHIIDTIGKWGVKTTPLQIRFNRPSIGDPVLINHLESYPYSSHKYAHITSIDGDRVSLCVGFPSMFLCESGAVSASGGPFFGCALNQLDSTMSLKETHFWNWGDNCAGAAQGVDYMIIRPVFQLNLGEAES